MLVAIFQLLAGTGMFLFAMHLIEEALKNLSGRPFKLFLQKATKNDISAVAGGALVTAVLQSSSLVSLMTLAFVGAGIFTFHNAMAVILGANLGTTLYSWVVATLGFKMDIKVAAYPAIGIGGFLVVLFSDRNALKYTGFFLLGFGLLFIGLGFMKEAMSEQNFNLAKYAHLPLIAFLGIGFLITLLVQSSSVMMALALSALNADMISYPIATALVLGSETGTSVKLFVASIGDNAVKKRVALGNFSMNVVLTILVFLFLRQIIWLITEVLGIKDPLIALVSFSTFNNILTIAVFLPLLGPFTRLLERMYTDSKDSLTPYLAKAREDKSTGLLHAFAKETALFIYTCLQFNRSLLEIDNDFPKNEEYEKLLEENKFRSKPPKEQYQHLKQAQGEMQSGYLAGMQALNETETESMTILNSAIRNALYSVKSMKDVQSNIDNLKHSSKDVKFELFKEHREFTTELYQKLGSFLQSKKSESTTVEGLLDEVRQQYERTLNKFYKQADVLQLPGMDITTAINFNREVYSSHKAIATAVREFLSAGKSDSIQKV